MSKLFSPIKIRGETVRNRVAMAPMWQCVPPETAYENQDGCATQWHLVHLGSRAMGGTGLIIVEFTGVSNQGRITPWDLGMWSDEHVESFLPITQFISSQGATPAIQLAHAGRRASHDRPSTGRGLLSKDNGGWESVAPSPVPHDEDSATPKELSIPEIGDVIRSFASASKLAVDAGFKVIELHFAHCYLGCQFLSPISNLREDEYGGPLENRCRFPLEVARAVRREIPDSMPLMVRISATEYVEGGWSIDDSVQFSRWLKSEGVDLIDCSSGGNTPDQAMKPYPGYQVPFSSRIKKEANILTGAVGLITKPDQAEQVFQEKHADVVLLGRELLRNPSWPLYAQYELDGHLPWPYQWRGYHRHRQSAAEELTEELVEE